MTVEVVNDLGVTQEVESVEVVAEGKPFSNRKSFAFSDEQMFNEVDAMIKQKPDGLTNTEFLHQALKHFIEAGELDQTFNQLPTNVVDIFKGDLEKLNVAFEIIRETFKTQMSSNAYLIHQREERLTRQFEKVETELKSQIESAQKEASVALKQVAQLEVSLEQAKGWQTENVALKETLGTLQQALISEQERVQGLQREVARCSFEEYDAMKTLYQKVKEEHATQLIQLEHLTNQVSQQQSLLEREREQFEKQLAFANQAEQRAQEELKEVREELTQSTKHVQELYQKLLKA